MAPRPPPTHECRGVFPTTMGLNDVQSRTYTTVHSALLHTDIYDRQSMFLRRAKLVDGHILHHSLDGSVKLWLSQAVLQEQVGTNLSWMGTDSTQAFAPSFIKNGVVFSANQVGGDQPTTYLAQPVATGGTPLSLANWLDMHGLGHDMLVQMRDPAVAVWTLMRSIYEARRQQRALLPMVPPELLADNSKPLAKIPRHGSETDNCPTSSPGLSEAADETAVPFSEQKVHADILDVAALSPGSWRHFICFAARN
jgi:hypothetical protein